MLEFHARFMKIKKILEFPNENHGNHENPTVPLENPDNYEKPIIPHDNHENYENL